MWYLLVINPNWNTFSFPFLPNLHSIYSIFNLIIFEPLSSKIFLYRSNLVFNPILNQHYIVYNNTYHGTSSRILTVSSSMVSAQRYRFSANTYTEAIPDTSPSFMFSMISMYHHVLPLFLKPFKLLFLVLSSIRFL